MTRYNQLPFTTESHSTTNCSQPTPALAEQQLPPLYTAWQMRSPMPKRLTGYCTRHYSRWKVSKPPIQRGPCTIKKGCCKALLLIRALTIQPPILLRGSRPLRNNNDPQAPLVGWALFDPGSSRVSMNQFKTRLLMNGIRVAHINPSEEMKRQADREWEIPINAVKHVFHGSINESRIALYIRGNPSEFPAWLGNRDWEVKQSISYPSDWIRKAREWGIGQFHEWMTDPLSPEEIYYCRLALPEN